LGAAFLGIFFALFLAVFFLTGMAHLLHAKGFWAKNHLNRLHPRLKLSFYLASKLDSSFPFVKKKRLFAPRKRTPGESYKNSISYSRRVISVNPVHLKMPYYRKAITPAFMQSRRKCQVFA
jgi:hypothetical protein